MTLANCERLLKFYEEGRGTAGDTNYVAPQPRRAKEMQQHIITKVEKIKRNMNNPQMPHSRYLSQFPEEVRDDKSMEKKDAKKSKR